MSMKEKIYFIHYFLFQFNETIHDEIKEILKMKLSEKPYASLFIFVMIYIDKSILENVQKKKSLNEDFKSFRGSTFKESMVRQSEVYTKIL
jgi:hypothetical protein